LTHRISPGGSYRIDRRFKGIGRIALASGTRNRKRFEALDAMLTELYEDGKLDLLRGIRDHSLTIQQVYEAKRMGQLPYLASELVVLDSLWDCVSEWLPRSARAEGSRKRYAVSFRSLRRSGVLSHNATVADLKRVDWNELRGSWPAGPADWNRLRAAVSRFLSVTLGDKYHPFRREVLRAFPRAQEPPGRVPELSIELFWHIVARTPEHAQAAYVLLAATGLRVGEYLSLEDDHLRHLSKEITVPGTKTAASQDVIPVGPEAWKWVKQAVPPPLGHKWLYKHWKRACAAAGAPELTLHDLRHFYGQSLVDAGRPEASVQQSMRHIDPRMTRRYTKRKDQGDNALTMDGILFPPGREESAREA